MKEVCRIFICLGLLFHSNFVVSTSQVSASKSVNSVDSTLLPLAKGFKTMDTILESELPVSRDSKNELVSLVPKVHHFLNLEKLSRLHKRQFMDTTEYSGPPRSVFLSQDHISREIPQNSSSIDFPSMDSVISSLGVPPAVDMFVSAIDTIPTHLATVDAWAQEARAGFMGYFESLSRLISKESGSVENKLFEAADAYSHRFFNLVHVKETEHPVLAAKMTRIILAMVLSLSLVFVIFGLALHLQRTLVARAHEEAAKQRPGAASEEIFFAMPYPHLREGNGQDNIVIVNPQQQQV